MPSADDPLLFLVLPPLGFVLAGIWGALWGSFFNVCIHRVGLYESVVRPASRCPRCGSGVAAYDNIPVLSWLLLRGRCRHCGLPISMRYPLVELLGIALALLVYVRFVTVGGDPLAELGQFFVYFAFCGVLLVLAGIDLDHFLIPDVITYPAIPVFFVLGIFLRDVAPRDLLIGLVAGYGIVAVTAEIGYLILRREVMGYGDAKLLAIVGALLGWRAVIFTFFCAPLVGLLVLVPPLLLRRKKVTGVEVPYGPFLAVAAVGYLLLGRYIPQVTW